MTRSVKLVLRRVQSAQGTIKLLRDANFSSNPDHFFKVAHKGEGTTPKVRGPVKLRSHLEQKLISLRCTFTQIGVLLVLANHFLYKNCVYERSERF